MNVYRHVTPLIVILLLTVLFVGVVTIHSTIDTAASFPLEGGALKYRGFDYVAWWYTTPPGDFSSSAAQASLNASKSTGANWVGVNVWWVQSSSTSNTIYPDSYYTQTDAAVIDAINDIHARGMSVMLKPIDTVIGGNSSTITPTDPTAWFASYAAFINHYAQIARDHGVELLCIGTEANGIDEAHYSNWSTVISGIRAIYSGPLTYAPMETEYKRVVFWGLLDYAGIDAYFPLSDAKTPSVVDAVTGWSRYVHNGETHNWLQEIETWQAAINKPVIFTEIGYQSVDYGASGYKSSGPYNPQLQANCYQATLQVFANKPWFAGMFWWTWYPDPNAGGAGNADFTPQNKPAQSVLTADWLGTPY
jgi:hypothetical protein